MAGRDIKEEKLARVMEGITQCELPDERVE